MLGEPLGGVAERVILDFKFEITDLNFRFEIEELWIAIG